MTALSHLSTILQETAGAPETLPPPEGAPGGIMDMLVPISLILGIFYVIMIRPERKKQRARQALLDALKKGDKVMTSSGIYGNVAAINDDVITLQVAEGVRMRFNRAAVQDILNKEDAVASKDEPKQAEKATATS